ncbi:MAG: hypothetical protein ACTSRW_04615 [Candidatus Helarchaeota archaeon]
MSRKEKDSAEIKNKTEYDVKKYKAEKALRRKQKKFGSIMVKGRMRDDKRVKTYSVTIPAQIRTDMDLKGGEYFLIKAKKDEIILKLIKTEENEKEIDE